MPRDGPTARPPKHLRGWPAVGYSLLVVAAFVVWLVGGGALVANVLPWAVEHAPGSQYRTILAVIAVWGIAFVLGRRVLLALERFLLKRASGEFGETT